VKFIQLFETFVCYSRFDLQSGCHPKLDLGSSEAAFVCFSWIPDRVWNDNLNQNDYQATSKNNNKIKSNPQNLLQQLTFLLFTILSLLSVPFPVLAGGGDTTVVVTPGGGSGSGSGTVITTNLNQNGTQSGNSSLGNSSSSLQNGFQSSGGSTVTITPNNNNGNYVAPNASNYVVGNGAGFNSQNLNGSLNGTFYPRPYIGDLASQKCEFNIFAGTSSNPTTQVGIDYQAGVSWSSQKCVDPQKIEKTRQIEETKRTALQTSAAQNIDCMRNRLIAIKEKIDPELICKVPQVVEIKVLSEE
jgi:hypothetical protein